MNERIRVYCSSLVMILLLPAMSEIGVGWSRWYPSLPSSIPECDATAQGAQTSEEFATIYIDYDRSSGGALRAIDYRPPPFLFGELCNTRIIKISPGVHTFHISFEVRAHPQAREVVSMTIRAEEGHAYDVIYRPRLFLPDHCAIEDLTNNQTILLIKDECGRYDQHDLDGRLNRYVWADEVFEAYGGEDRYFEIRDTINRRLIRLLNCLNSVERSSEDPNGFCEAFPEYANSANSLVN